MGSKWNHPICDKCWHRRCVEEGEPGRIPFRVAGALLSRETCCFCKETTESGIYVRENPEKSPCKGVHEESEESDKPKIEDVARFGESISLRGKELGSILSKRMIAFRDEVLKKTGNVNLANNAAIYGAAVNLALSMALVVRASKKDQTDFNLDKVFSKITVEVNESVLAIMEKYLGPESSILTLEIEEKKKKPKKGPA